MLFIFETPFMRVSLLLFLFVFTISAGNAQDQTFLKGMVTQTEVSNDTLSLPYSIYLPVNYTGQEPSKVLFVFDPNGEGVRAARLFTAATEPDDFVIVSNNFPLPQALDSLDANANKAILMMRDVFLKIPIKQNDIYLTGLRSGARVASALSYVVTNASRLLLVDDMYFANRFSRRAGRNLVMGLVGRSSPNYYQMSDYFYLLNTFSRDNELYAYENTGEWPDAVLLRVMLNRLKHINGERLNREQSDSAYAVDYSKDLEALKSIIDSREYLTGYDLIQDAKSDYRGYVDLDPIRDLQRSVRRSDAYKQARRNDRSGNIEEQLLLEDIDYFLDEDFAMANFENLGYWDERIRQFEAASKNSSKPKEQQVAKRILGFIDYKIEDFLFLNTQRLIPQRIFVNVLNTILHPEEPKSYLDIISLSAQDQDYNTAFFYLEELLKQGYEDYESLYEIPNTELLKIKPTYNELIKSYLGKAKF